MRPLAFALPLLILLLPLASAESYPGFDVRYGIPAGTDVAALIDRPALISMRTENSRDPITGERRLSGYGEAHGVYDIPYASMLEVLENPAGALSYSPRLLRARIEDRKGPRMVVYQEVGISFLGIKVGYGFRSEQVRDDISPTETGYRLRLLESLDGNLFEAYSSVYAKEVIVGGKRLVYLRVYSRPGLRRPGLGMDLVIRSFTPAELTGMLNRAAQEGSEDTSLRPSRLSDVPSRVP